MKISQADFVDLVERARLTDTQSIYLRLYMGIDDEPQRMDEISRQFGVSTQAVSVVFQSAKKRIAQLPYAPVKIDRPRGIKTPYNLEFRDKHMMTVARAQQIIGQPIGVGDVDHSIASHRGYIRVACRDAFGEVLSETARNIPAALELLIRSNYARVRAFVLHRDNYRCTNCGGFSNLETDHKVSRARGNRCDKPENLVTICHGCHVLRHKTRGFHL